MTAQPAAAKRGSSSRAMGASTDEKIMRGRSDSPLAPRPAASGVLGWRTMLGDARGEGRVETPGAGFGVGLAGAAVAGGEPGDVEPGVVREELDESLSDHAGRAENAYVTPFHLLRIYKQGRRRVQVRRACRGFARWW